MSRHEQTASHPCSPSGARSAFAFFSGSAPTFKTRCSNFGPSHSPSSGAPGSLRFTSLMAGGRLQAEQQQRGLTVRDAELAQVTVGRLTQHAGAEAG